MSKKETAGLYLWLAGINLFISAFTFGGGYVVVPMVRRYFVEKRKVFSEEELMEMAAVAQSTPGAIAVNLAALSGYRTAGRTGLVISSVCALIPSVVILSIVSICYSAFLQSTLVAAALKGMQAAAAALIVDFIADMAARIRKERSLLLDGLALVSFAVSFFTDCNVIFILLAAGFVCVVQGVIPS